MRAGYITPSRFKDIMTVGNGYKTKEELQDELAILADAQHKREQKGSTSTAIYATTAKRIAALPELIKEWSPELRFGGTAKSYAIEVALGRFGIVKDQVTAKSLEHGITFEIEARSAYEEATSYHFPKEDFRMVSEVYPFIAGEADGNIYGRDKKWGGEIKCPANPVNHLNNMIAGTDLGDRLEIKSQHDELYKWQTTGYCAPWMYGWDGYTFISYNPFYPESAKLHYTDYERDESLEDELETTLILFENKVVCPLVNEFTELFKTKVEQKWNTY